MTTDYAHFGMTSPNKMAKVRGFEIVSSYQTIVTELPSRKTEHSAGYDLACAEDVIILSHEIKLVPTGLKAYMQSDEVLKLYARSSLAVQKQLILANGVGVVDRDYYNNVSNEGHILLPLYNAGDKTILLEKGERVAQGIFEKYLQSETETIPAKERTGGFGSTGR